MRFHNGKRRVSALITVLLLVLTLTPVSPAAASTMIPQAPIPTGKSPKGIAIGDVDGDGRNDVAVADFRGSGITGTVSIYLQRPGGGLGTAPDQTITLPYLGNAASVRIADFTGDGKNDVLVGDTWYQYVHIYEAQLGGFLRVYSIPMNTKGGATPGGPVSSPFNFDMGFDELGAPALLVPRFYVTSHSTGDTSQFQGDNGGFRLEVLASVPAPDYTSIAAVPGRGFVSSFAVAVGGYPGYSDYVFSVSQDDGEHWRYRGGPKQGIRAVAFWDAQSGWAVGGGNVLRSLNGGHDWEVFNVADKPELNAVCMQSADSAVAVGDMGRIYRFKEGDWTKVTNNVAVADFEACSFRIPDFGYAVGGDLAARFVSNAEGALEARPEALPLARAYHGVSIDPGHDVAIAVGDGGAIARRTELSTVTAAWDDIASPTAVDLHAVHMIDRSTGFAAGDDGTILETLDGGMTWAPLDSGTGEDLTALTFLDADEGWVTGVNGTLLHTVDGGLTWHEQSSNQYGGSSSMNVIFTSAVNPYSAVLADFDDDGKTDIGTLGYLGGTFTPMYAGGGNYPNSVLYSSIPVIASGLSEKGLAVAAGDLNGDAKTDVAAISYTSSEFKPNGSLSVALQNCLSWLSNGPSQELPTGVGPQDLVLGDVTGDGLTDAIVPNSYNTGSSFRTTGTVGVFVQNAEGKLAPMLEFDVGRQPYHAAVGDLDGDGKNEIVVTNQVSNTIQVLKYGNPLPPKVASPTWAASASYSRSVVGTISLSAPPDFDGIAGYHYTIDHSANTVPTSSARFTTKSTFGINFDDWKGTAANAQGEWYIHVVSKDRAGHIGNRASHYRVRLDLTAPSAIVAATGGATWTETAMREVVWAAASDSLSGIAYYSVFVDGSRIATTTETKYAIDKLRDGRRAIRVDAVDRAGNVRVGTTDYANIDAGSPTASILTPAANALISRTFTFKANCTDAAGVRNAKFFIDGRLLYTDSAYPFALQYDTRALATGAHTLKVVAMDMFGHTATASRSFKSDNQAPVMSSVSGSPSPVFYPILKDGYMDSFTARFTTNESGTAYLQVYTGSGSLYREIKTSKAAGANSIAWNGVSKTGTKTKGTFYWRIVMKDAAGNITTTSKRAITIKDYQVVYPAPNVAWIIPR